MTDNPETFVVKPTLFMILMAEKGVNNIRKIFFVFRDLQFCSLELNDGAVVVTNHDPRNRDAILKSEKDKGLVEHIMLGEAAVLPNEEVSELFHTLWTKAAGLEDYDKKQWMQLSRILMDRGYNL